MSAQYVAAIISIQDVTELAHAVGSAHQLQRSGMIHFTEDLYGCLTKIYTSLFPGNLQTNWVR